MRASVWGFVVVLAAFAVACDKPTIVELNFSGTVAQKIERIDLSLALAGKTSATTFGNDGTDINLPTSATLEIHGDLTGPMTITATAKAAGGTVVAATTTTVTVVGHKTTPAAIVFGNAMPDLAPGPDLAGTDLTGEVLPDLTTVTDDLSVAEDLAAPDDLTTLDLTGVVADLTTLPDLKPIVDMTPPPKTLTVAITRVATGKGYIDTADSAINCGDNGGTTCTKTYASSTSVTLRQHATTGYFGGWEGACASAGKADTCTITVSAATSVGARFSPANVTFVTSTTLTMPLGATDAAAHTAADNECKARATAAGLSGTFVAFLSTAGRSARSKLGSSNGWIRPDGKPVAESQVELFDNGHMLYLPNMNESSGATQFNVATGTLSDGTVSSSGNCSNFTSTSGTTMTMGGYIGSVPTWTRSSDSEACNQAVHLRCFQTNYDVKVKAKDTGRFAFMTNAAFQPGPGKSRADIDALCASEASSAGLPGTYKAFAATNGTVAGDTSRFSTSGAAWVRTDGVLLKATAAAFFAASGYEPDVPANINATGGVVEGGDLYVGYGGYPVPTTAGTANSTCSNWTSDSLSFNATAVLGFIRLGYSSNFFPCSYPGHFLCLQQ